ncbi:hypothetical protein MKJ04_13480 [Pontibacter sp. E15-1]|uniref:hypothetical protein n=1 Tax=Pontibacter sp. E15-1 TaxID=2919918 RepID=UPI001F502ECE|nr:hypothetical protein [Pontibacter sp. E15-1]MCJ8165858.1 hypothetical protein [Pontibacter sp. E15-1]
MELQETAAGGYAAVYKHSDTGAFWFLCYATSAAQGGGYQLLIRLPLPTTAQLIDIALQSAHEDETVAAVFRLLDEEALEKKEFRQSLVEKLEQQLLLPQDAPARKRMGQVIKLTELDSPLNRREVLRKTQTEIAQDAADFTAIANRATRVLEKIRPSRQ